MAARRSAMGFATAAWLAAASLAHADCDFEVRALTEASHPLYPATAAERASAMARAAHACGEPTEPPIPNPVLLLDAALYHALAGEEGAALREARAAAPHGPRGAWTLASALELRAGDAAGAVESAMQGARQGDRVAQYDLGVAYAEGRGVARDEQAAFHRFDLAAHGGDVPGMLETAQRFLEGRGVPLDAGEAGRWWRKAAESLAIESVPHPARWPRAVPYDPREALGWLRARAAAGEPWAAAFLGLLYERGVWVGQDLGAAMAWYRRAADDEYAPAEMRIAMLYSHGRGVPKDYALSRQWGERGIVRGCERAAASRPDLAPCDRFAADPYDPRSPWAGIPASACRRWPSAHAPPARRPWPRRPGSRAFARSSRGRSPTRGATPRRGARRNARRRRVRAARRHSSPPWTSWATAGPATRRPRSRATAVPRPRATRARCATCSASPRRSAGRGARAGEPVDRWREEPRAGAARARRGGRCRGAAQPRLRPGAARRAFRGDRLVPQGRGRGRPRADEPRADVRGRRGVARDPAVALAMYRKRAERGDAEAQWRTARLLGASGDWSAAARWLERLVVAGDMRGVVELAVCHEEGRGVPRDAARALALYERALALYERAAPSSPWAEFKAGWLRYSGDGVPRDVRGALRAFSGAAAHHHPAAMNNLGVMHERGEGTAADLDGAVDWYLKALGAGSGRALGNLEAIYESGRGAPKAGPDALAWYRRGAQAGVGPARYRLARLYEAPGPQQDFREAARWHEANAQDPRSLRALAALYRSGALAPAAGADAARAAGAASYVASLLEAKAQELEAHGAPPRSPSGPDPEAGHDPRREMALRVGSMGSTLGAPGDMGWFVVISPALPANRPARPRP